MRLFLIMLLVGLIASSALGQTIPGVECELLVHQLDDDRNPVLLWADTTTFSKGVAASGFLISFSIDLEVIEADSAACHLRLHAVTLGPPIYNYAREYQIEYGLPAKMNPIVGKDGIEYSLTITPIGRREVDTTNCPMNHIDGQAFEFTPSGHMDIYYAKNTFADFYWNGVKDVLEDRYRLFKAINNFNLPGKYQIYLCPCAITSVIWDKRFGMMVDPTRSSAFGIYTKEFNSADPFLVLLASAYRNYGYAPAFLADGLAGYLALPEFRMKDIVFRQANLPLDSLLDTYAYYQSDPDIADKTSASLVRYLIGEYGVDKFLGMYKRAHDLNLRRELTETYGKPIAELEIEWLNYIDSLTFERKDLVMASDLAEVSFDYQLMAQYNDSLYLKAKTAADSINTLQALGRASFAIGNYYAATEHQATIARLQPDFGGNWVAVGGYQLMNGLYDEAAESLSKAGKINPEDQLVEFNLALHALVTGQKELAQQMWAGIILKGGGPQAETRALYGNLLAQSDSPEDQAKAQQYCAEALNVFAQSLRSGSASSDAYLWSGVASLGMGDSGNAWDFLQLALFMETRPFYQGMAALWLGKVADILDDHKTASEYYGQVIAGASADYHQQEAKRLMKEPYQQ